jgi:signal recognition particle GTPase
MKAHNCAIVKYLTSIRETVTSVPFLGVWQGYEELERFDPEWLIEQSFEE